MVMAVGSIHAQAAQTGGTKGQTRGAYQSGYVPSGKFGGRLSYIQYMSKMVTQQMRVVLCTNQRQKVSGASATAVPALPWVLPWLEKAGEVFGAIILGIFFYEGTKEDKDSKDSLEGWGDEQEEDSDEEIESQDVDVDNLPEGWSKTEHNGFIHIRDENGTIRIRIDPPDKNTLYPHKHLYDKSGNPIDINGNPVDRRSPDAHIPLNE